MSTPAVRTTAKHWTDFERLRAAREVILAESRTLHEVARRLGDDFCRAVDRVLECSGTVIVTGIGKAGLIGKKVAATLSSTGTPSHTLHPAEAVHGDLGCVRTGDLALVFSQSGETDEVLRLLPSLRELGIPIIALTGSAASTLGRAAASVLELGAIEEAGDLRLAPTCSAAAMLAVGDALALVVSQIRAFRREDFARNHPGGSLGLRLSKVDDVMRPLDQCRVASQDQSVREVLVGTRVVGRRTGATMLLDDAGRLAGIFTDSDLARLFEARREADLDAPIRSVMTARPLRATAGAPLSAAIEVLSQRKISELPVVDDQERPVGLIDITDVLTLMPTDVRDETTAARRAGAWPPPDGVPTCRVFREHDDPAGA